MTIFECIGWVGSVLFIVSYFLLSIKKLNANKVPYQLMNVLGGLCLVVSAYSTQDRPNMFTNFVWIIIGLYAIFSIVRGKFKK